MKDMHTRDALADEPGHPWTQACCHQEDGFLAAELLLPGRITESYLYLLEQARFDTCAVLSSTCQNLLQKPFQPRLQHDNRNFFNRTNELLNYNPIQRNPYCPVRVTASRCLSR